MTKTILVTGSTDGIGLETAKLLVSKGHTVLLHGRSQAKLDNAERALSEVPGGGRTQKFTADLSSKLDVEALATLVADDHPTLDVLINNAGVFKTSMPVMADGLDVRFVVNTLAPYLLTKHLMPCLGTAGRVINLSSAAQAPVELEAVSGGVRLPDMDAYAQSKLALTMWNQSMAGAHPQGPVFVAVNPGSLLASKMVQEGFGVAGGDLQIGAEILARAALDDDFATATGKYFDNDIGQFSQPHSDALDHAIVDGVLRSIDAALAKWRS